MAKKITADMLPADLGPVVGKAFKMLYPTGLTMEELEKKAQERKWLKRVYDYFGGGQ